jgi:hypothetical protein
MQETCHRGTIAEDPGARQNSHSDGDDGNQRESQEEHGSLSQEEMGEPANGSQLA